MDEVCLYLENHECQKFSQRDNLDCLMCLHGQMIIYQQHIMNLIESATLSLCLARNIMKTQDYLVEVNCKFEDLMIEMHPNITKRREVHMAHFRENPLVS